MLLEIAVVLVIVASVGEKLILTLPLGYWDSGFMYHMTGCFSRIWEGVHASRHHQPTIAESNNKSHALYLASVSLRFINKGVKR